MLGLRLIRVFEEVGAGRNVRMMGEHSQHHISVELSLEKGAGQTK